MKKQSTWGGRFKDGVAKPVEEFGASVEYDGRLYLQDIEGSIAHARVMAEQGIISHEEADNIAGGLLRIRAEIEDGRFEWKNELEDVHMNIETRLVQIIGDTGKKLHTGRSRNDQVCLDFRLYVGSRLEIWQELLLRLIRVFTSRAKEHRGTLMPGYTHFQPAQPVSLAHHLLAYAQMFRRDYQRIEDALKRVLVSPLGAAALAGTTYPLNPEKVAAYLNMKGCFVNSMDAVSDRDFAAEALFIAGLAMIHLSRFSEEIILWANPSLGFITLPDAYSTGSSIMPQKKNPDTAELTRGRTGRVLGNLVSLLTTLKGLPMTYNRDLQEDKEPFFDTDATICSCLEVCAGLLDNLKFNPDAMRKAVRLGFLNATELADYLVARGMPFRDAHHVVGNAVAYAEEKGVTLEDMSLEELRGFSELIEEDVSEVLRYETAVGRRNTRGGTGPLAVEEQLGEIMAWIEEKDK